MALSITAAVKDKIAYLLRMRAYASLTAAEQGLVDGESASALTTIEQWAQPLTHLVASGNAPDEFEPWLIDESVYRCMMAIDPDRVTPARQRADRSQASSIQTYLRNSPAYTPSSPAEAFVYTLLNIRHFVLSHCTRINQIYIPEISTIDASTWWAVQWIWEKGGWNFRRRQVVLSIASTEVVTVSSGLESGETIDSIASLVLRQTTSGYEGQAISWATAEVMDYLRTSDTNTGVPTRFRVHGQTGSTLKWQFHPVPDGTYTARCEVLVRAPAVPTSATSTTEMANFTDEFLPRIRDLTLAHVLYSGRRMGRNEFEAVLSGLDSDLAGIQRLASGAEDARVRDHYGDPYDLAGSTFFGGGF